MREDAQSKRQQLQLTEQQVLPCTTFTTSPLDEYIFCHNSKSQMIP